MGETYFLRQVVKISESLCRVIAGILCAVFDTGFQPPLKPNLSEVAPEVSLNLEKQSNVIATWPCALTIPQRLNKATYE